MNKRGKSGCVANNLKGNDKPLFILSLSSDSKDFIDERNLSQDIPFFDMFDLAFPNHIHQLVLWHLNCKATIAPLKSLILSCNAEGLIDEGDLSQDIAFVDILDLTFSDHIHVFIPSDGLSSGSDFLPALYA